MDKNSAYFQMLVIMLSYLLQLARTAKFLRFTSHYIQAILKEDSDIWGMHRSQNSVKKATYGISCGHHFRSVQFLASYLACGEKKQLN